MSAAAAARDQLRKRRQQIQQAQQKQAASSSVGAGSQAVSEEKSGDSKPQKPPKPQKLQSPQQPKTKPQQQQQQQTQAATTSGKNNKNKGRDDSSKASSPQSPQGTPGQSNSKKDRKRKRGAAGAEGAPASGTADQQQSQQKSKKPNKKQSQPRNEPEEDAERPTPSKKQKQHKSQQQQSQQKKSQSQQQELQLPSPGGAAASGLSELQSKMQRQLHGAQFRFLNEQLYTSDSKSAVQLFKEDPQSFEIYHTGFRSQAESWPVNPVDIFVKMLAKRPGITVGDFGCGEAMLALKLKDTAKRVHSFDLVALNHRVTPCDIANVPLEDNTIDVAVFSLSLMGLNWMDFIREAHRVLKPGGHLLVAEVRSRFGVDDSGTDDAMIRRFTDQVCGVGLRFRKQVLKNKIFVILEFTKTEDQPPAGKGKKQSRKDHNAAATFQFKPCIYKRR